MINCEYVWGKMLRSALAAGIVLTGMSVYTGEAHAADLSIKVPTERAIYQRGYDNTADMTIIAEFDETSVVKARVIDGGSELCEWTELEKGDGSEYTGVLKGIPGGGWYEVEVAAYDSSGSETASGNVENVGVGEVFITGGQSNSTNFGGKKISAENDLVSAADVKNGRWVHCEDSQPNNSGFNTGNGGGSPWPAAGDRLADELGVPIGFLSTGVGGSLIAELADPDKNYKPVKEAIEFLKPYGCRAFLIHQGEADSGGMNGNPGTDMEEYKETFERLIAMTREDAGYDLNWLIARVSYAWSGFNNPSRTEEVTSTQTSLCNNYNIFVGPNTDGLQGEDRHTDNLHLSEQGLIKHGTMWSECIIDAFFTPRKLSMDASVNGGKIEQCDIDLYGGQTVILTAVADEGYYLVPDSYKVTDGEGNSVELDGDSFIMRAEDMTVSAEFRKLPQYLLSLDSKIREAKAMDTGIYQAEYVAEFRAAITAAENIYAKGIEASEDEAYGAIAAIDAASKKLAASMIPANQTSAVQTPVTIQLPPSTTVTDESSAVKYTVKAKNKTITVKRGKQVSVKYSVTKGFNGRIKFVSSNKKIADVSQKGKVKGLKKGKCKITIQLISGKKVISKSVVKITVK